MPSTAGNSRGSTGPPGSNKAPHGTTRSGNQYKDTHGKPHSTKKSKKKHPKNVGGGRHLKTGGAAGAPRGRGRPPSKYVSSSVPPPAPSPAERPLFDVPGAKAPAPGGDGHPLKNPGLHGSDGGGVTGPRGNEQLPAQHRVSLPSVPASSPGPGLGPSGAVVDDDRKQPFEILAPEVEDSPSSLGSSYRHRLGVSRDDHHDEQSSRRSAGSRSRRSDATRRPLSGSAHSASIQRSDVAAMIDENRTLIDERLDRDKAVIDQRLDTIQNMLASLCPGPTPAPAPAPTPSTGGSSATAASDRAPVDIALRSVCIYGEEYQTSPIMFQIGDRPLWLYSKNLLLPVEILEATPPALWRRQPTYHAKFLEGEGSRVGRHDIHHDDLFIPIDRDNTFDPSGRLDANLESLRVGDQLDAHAMPGYNATLIQRWGAMNMASFKTKDFIASIKDEILASDTLTAIEHYYSTVQIYLQSSHRDNIDILPDLSELSPTTSLRDLLLPPPSYSRFGRAKSCYDSIGRVIHMILHRKEFTSKAPLAGAVLSRFLGGTTDGWDLLHELLKGRLPYLGATDFDVNSVIASVKVSNGMLFSDFIHAAQQAQRTILVSGMSTLPNALLKHFFREIMRCDNLSPLMAAKNQHFHEYLRATGNKSVYQQESVDSIIKFLNLGRPPLRLQVSDDLVEPSPLDPSRMASFGGQNSILPYNRPTLAAMTPVPPPAVPPPVDDATVLSGRELGDPSPPNYDDLLSSVVKPVLASLSVPFDTPEAENLLMAAMKRFSSKRRRCDCCEGAHDADRCYARGPAFQPPPPPPGCPAVQLEAWDYAKSPLRLVHPPYSKVCYL